MKQRPVQQSDYMTLQLMEIERLRVSLSQANEKPITFQEAVMLWITEGYAEAFRSQYSMARKTVEPALA